MKLEVELTKGDPMCHLGDDGRPLNIYRSNLTGKDRAEQRERRRNSHMTITQVSQVHFVTVTVLSRLSYCRII